MALLNENFLSEAFEMCGSDLEEFEIIIKEIDEHTVYLPRELKKMALLSIAKPDEQVKADFIKCYILNPSCPIINETLKVDYLPKQVFSNQGNFDELINDMVGSGQSMILDLESDTPLFLSEKSINTLAQRIGVTGESLRKQSIERDVYIASKMFQNTVITLIVKQYRQVGKIFAFMSNSYINIPLSSILVLYDIINQKNSLGEMVCSKWEISHERASITFAFKEYANELMVLYGLNEKITPCIEISTSDIGTGSLIIRGCWKTSCGHYFYDRHKYAREHRTDLDMDEIAHMVQEEILNNYDELPSRLTELMTINITPKELDLSDEINCGQNWKVVMEAFKSAFNQLDMVKYIGKKREIQLVKYIDYETINDMLHYTAYDIFQEIIAVPAGLEVALPKTLKMRDETRRKLMEAVSLAPYLEFEKFEKIKDKRKEPL